VCPAGRDEDGRGRGDRDSLTPMVDPAPHPPAALAADGARRAAGFAARRGCG